MGTAYKIRCRHCGAQFEHHMQPGYGVLPVCVGKATRAAELIVAADKEYIAKLTFGSETDTQDSTGSVTNTTQNRTDIKTFEDVKGI